MNISCTLFLYLYHYFEQNLVFLGQNYYMNLKKMSKKSFFFCPAFCPGTGRDRLSKSGPSRQASWTLPGCPGLRLVSDFEKLSHPVPCQDFELILLSPYPGTMMEVLSLCPKKCTVPFCWKPQNFLEKLCFKIIQFWFINFQFFEITTLSLPKCAFCDNSPQNLFIMILGTRFSHCTYYHNIFAQIYAKVDHQ